VLIDPILRKKLEEYQPVQPSPPVKTPTPSLSPWMGQLPSYAPWLQQGTPVQNLMQGIQGLTGGYEDTAMRIARAASQPFRPAPTLPSQRPPTPEEKAKGSFMYQPTGAEEKAYEEWQAPSISTEGLHAFKFPWTPEETKPWELSVKTPLEELAYLPLWMTGGGAAKAPVEAAARGIERRTPQIVKTALKEEAGMARLPKPRPEVPKPPIAPEPVTPQPAVDKMLNLLKVEKPILRETKQLRHVELQRKASMIGKAIAEGEPEAAMAQAAKLRGGKLPTAEGALRDQFTPDEASQLFGVIRDSSLRSFEKLNANDAFLKLLQTNDPLTRSEIRLLGEVFGLEFVGMFDTLGRKIVKTLLDTANLPRALLASGDLSATFRQGGILLSRRPYLAPKMVKEEVKYFFSDKSLQEADSLLRSHPDFGLYNELGGYMAPLPGKASQLWKAEEAFMSRFAQHIPIVKQSERAFVGGLNWLRFNSYVHGKRLYEKMGVATDENLKDLIKLITRASGRGDINLLKGDVGPILNAILFSPRLQISRMQLPSMLMSKNPATRKEAWKTMASFLAFGTGIISMAVLAGAKTELDPRSSDFGKIIIGKTRLDIWTGYAQYARLLAQLTTGQRKQVSTGKLVEINRKDVLDRFLQSKLAPATGLLNDILQGVTYMGEEMSFETENLRRQAYNRLTQLFFQDMIDAVSEEGLMGGVTASAGFWGAGVVTHRPQGAPIFGKSPAQQLEDRVWSQYPSQLRQIADQIRELERTDPTKAKALQRQYPQILNIRRQIALAQVQQPTTDRQKAIEQATKQREAALAGMG